MTDRALIRETVRETLTALGIDMSDPTAVQKDLAYVRQQRLVAERIAAGTRLAILTTFIGGLGTLIVTAILWGLGWRSPIS